jgi:fluoride exporter
MNVSSFPLGAQLLAIAAGAVLGAWLRYFAGLAFNASWHGFPLGTLLVNCAGGLAVGAALHWLSVHPNDILRLVLVTGLLGALTTFSAFSAESLALLLKGEWGYAVAHTLAHVCGALACAALGHWAMRTAI